LRQPRLLETGTRVSGAQTDQLNHSTSPDHGLSWPAPPLVVIGAM
jgi:hypothetical protein